MKPLQWPNIDVFAPDAPEPDKPQGPPDGLELDCCVKCGHELGDGEVAYLRQRRVYCKLCNEIFPRWSASNPATWANHGRRRRTGE